MAWHIVSVPMWLLTALFFMGAIFAAPVKKSHETYDDIANQIIFGLIMSTLCGSIAAWMVN